MNIILGYVEENFVFIAAALLGLLFIVLWHYFERQPSARKTDGIKIDLKACLEAVADIRHQTLTNSVKLQELENETKSIQASVEHVEQGMASVRGVVDEVLSQAKECKAEAPQPQTERPSEPMESMPPAVREFRDLYNVGVEDSSLREELRQNYEKHYRIGVANASERRLNLEQPPILNTDTSGNFLAFYIETEDLHAVVPLYGLVIQESIHGPGAFGEVFECPDFDAGRRYREIKVMRPAIFEPDVNREQWTIKERGKLDLGSGF